MAVRVLDSSVCANIRSAYTLDSLPQCVVELALNSVDAGASSLVVKVDTRSWKIQVYPPVSDNGEGIPRDDLSLVGQRYATSKCCTLENLQESQYFGFRGEALACIVQMAHTVEITSRHRLSQQTWKKVFQCGCSVGVVSASPLNKSGTNVNVCGLFYNMPVRRRHISPALVVKRLKSVLCKVFLVLPLVSFTVYDEQTGEYILHVPRATSLLNRFGQLFGTERALGVCHTSVECAGIKVSALLSVHALHSKCLQLIYMNRRPVENQSLHMLVCSLLEPACSKIHKNRSLTRCNDKQGPFYVLVINCDVDFDTCLKPDKTYVHVKQEDQIHTALTSLLSTFLSDNHLSVPYSHSSTIASTSTSTTSISGSRERTTSIGSSRERTTSISSSRERTTGISSSRERTTSISSSRERTTGISSSRERTTGISSSRERTTGISSSRKRKSHGSPTKSLKRSSAPLTCQPQLTAGPQKVAIPWKTRADPTTSHAIRIHPVSGCSYTTDQSLNTISYQCNRVFSMSSLTQNPSSDKPILQHTPSSSSLLSGWKNPTFSVGDEAVLAVGGGHNAHTHCKFSKHCFQQIKVFGQVERKFIACLLEAQNSSFPDLLVAFDQHAAHERIRLEALMKRVYDKQQQVCVTELIPPVALALTPSQKKIASQFSKQLETIGVHLQYRASQLVATTLPCVLMKEEDEEHRGCPAISTSVLQDMVISHLQLLENTGGGVAGLPSSLAAVLHSLACHGAIRFGDHLCLAECEQLIHSLKHCALPFQCAHGRPSLAPLIDLHLLRTQFPSLHTPFPVLERLHIATERARCDS